MNEEALLRRLDRIEKSLSKLVEKKREVWVGAADVMRATGWNKDDMYRARKTGMIVFKKVGKSICYDPNSIPSIFIRNENATNRGTVLDGPR